MNHVFKMVIDYIHQTDLFQKVGSVLTFVFGGISFTDIETGLRIVFLIISITLGIVTLKYTQEKRKALKTSVEKKDEDDDIIE